MFSEDKVTEIYCMADDFCKEFARVQEKYMVEDKNHKHRNKPNRMSDAEIMVILILFHSGGFRCFKHYYKEYVCKHLIHLFPKRVSYNRFVELEKEVLLQLTVFIKEVLLGTSSSSRRYCWVLVPASVSWIPLRCAYAGTSAFSSIRPSKVLRNVENVPWDGSLDLSYT